MGTKGLITEPSPRSAGFTGDDMVDPDGWLQSPALGDVLKHCRDKLLKRYQELDTQAKDDQLAHFRKARFVAGLAFLAIFVALLQLWVQSLFPISPASGGLRLFLQWGLFILGVLAGLGAAAAALLGVYTARAGHLRGRRPRGQG